MGKKIIVAGAGHGGLVAAYRLAIKGYDVTVYERVGEGELGYEWEDFFDADIFKVVGLPEPESGKIHKVPISFYGPNPEDDPITQTVGEDEFEMHMYRKELYAHILKSVVDSGVKIVYNCEVLEPVMIGNRVIGIMTSIGEFIADLVIDACGINSPLRSKLPPYLGIQREFKKYDYLYTYRAYYNRLDGYEDIPNIYKVYFVDDGKKGLSWAVTTENTVDLLIGRFEPYGNDEIEKMYNIFKADNPQLGDKLILGGQICPIPLRQPIAMLVADGYAAVGDCACMTVPIVGSGIANSMRAGAILAEAVVSDTNHEYSVYSLWKYQYDFYKKVGITNATVDLFKTFLAKITKEDIEFFFNRKILTSEDLAISSNETSVKAMFSNITLSVIIDRVKKVGGNPELLKKVGSIALSAGKLKLIMTRFPETYSRDSVIKWANRYNKFFAGLIDD